MYEFKEITLRNAKHEKKRLVINFKDPKYAILAEFLMSDAHLLREEIAQAKNKISKNIKSKIMFSGNRCAVEIENGVTEITDLYMDEEDGGYETLNLPTQEFFVFVNMWSEAIANFNSENN